MPTCARSSCMAPGYAELSLIATQGKLGRSEGCFVFGDELLPQLLAKPGPGRSVLRRQAERGARVAASSNCVGRGRQYHPHWRHL